MPAVNPVSSSFWNTSRGVLLLQCLIPRREIVIRSTATAGDKAATHAAPSQEPASHADAVRHEWVNEASFDACFRARCPRCGVVREYDTRGDHAWVTYSSYGEFLAHGRLGHVAVPECGTSTTEWPDGWDVLELT